MSVAPTTPEQRRSFIQAQTVLAAPPLTPEIKLHLATEITPIWEATEATLEARTSGGEWVPVTLTAAETDAPTGAVDHDGGIFVESRAWVSGYTAQVPVPDRGGWVDLRVTAKDAEGNTFSQEIERAFEATPAKGAR